MLVEAADIDLSSAEKLASGEPLLGPATYHCTLAAEKALKAYLLFRDVQPPDTHDLTLLVESLLSLEPEARRLREAAEVLTPYGDAYRSMEPFGPSRDEFEEALTYAYEVHDFVTARLPEPE